MKIYNSATHTKEEFVPHEPGKVSMYTCGPTVYHFAHIGNLRSYIMEDVLEKLLRYAGYDVTRVMNITDVGHLASDADTGVQTKGREYIGTDILHAHPGDINRFLYGLNNTITHNLFQIFSINLLIFYFIEQIVHLCIQFFSKCLINLMFCTSLIQKGFVFFFYELIDIRSHMRHLFSWFCAGNK